MRVRVRDGSMEKMSTLGLDWQHIGVGMGKGMGMGMGMGTGNWYWYGLYEFGIMDKG